MQTKFNALREINADFKRHNSDTGVNPVKPFLRGNLRQAGACSRNNDVKQTTYAPYQPLQGASAPRLSLGRIIFSAGRETGNEGKRKKKMRGIILTRLYGVRVL